LRSEKISEFKVSTNRTPFKPFWDWV